MKMSIENHIPIIQISKNKKEENFKINNNSHFLFPQLSEIIEEIGVIKMIEDKRILCDYSNYYHVKYLIERKKGIETIKTLSLNFNFSIDVFVKAIYYMDRYFLSNKINNIFKISSICLLLSLKYNESCPKTKNYKKFYIYLSGLFGNIIQIENEILMTLDYDLNTFTLIDYIRIFFIKHSNSINKLKKFQELTRIMWFYAIAIIEDQRFLDFTSSEIACCIIHFTLLKHFLSINKCYLNKEWNEYPKNYFSLDKMKFAQCKLICNIILSYKFKDFFIFK